MQRLVEYADELVTSIGPRPGASQGEHQAAELIASHLEELGLDTEIQEFQSARSVGWVRILYYLVGVIAAEILFALPGLSALAMVLALVAAALLALDLLGISPFFNLFNRGLSQNVVARYVPEGADPRRKVVIVAHYDSGRSMLQCAPVVTPFYEIIRKAIRVCVFALVVVAFLLLLPLPEVIALIFSIVALIIGILLFLSALVEIVNLFMPYNQGANSNASGVAAALGIAQTLVGVRSNAFGQETPRASSTRAGRASFLEPSETAEAQDSPRGRGGKGGTGPLASIGGAAGSLFSRARGLVAKDAAEAAGELVDDDEAVELPQRASAQQRQPRTADLAVLSRTAADTASTEDTADLGRKIPRTPPAAQPVAQPTDNPAIRTRPPLAEQQELAAIAQQEAERSASERTEDGLPKWFVEAKKAAHEEQPETRRSAAAAASGKPEIKVQRSRFADSPVASSPKPEPAPEGKLEAQLEAKSELKPGAQPGSAVLESPHGSKQDAEPSAASSLKMGEGFAEAKPRPASTQGAASAPSAAGQAPAAHEGSQPLEQESASVTAAFSQHKGGVTQQEPASSRAATASAAAPVATQTATPAREQVALPSVHLPESATALERAAAAPTPSIPTNDRLANLPSLALGNSGAIPTQQAAFNQQPLFALDEEQAGSTRISNTGSFAPLGATGLMKPVGEELLDYHEEGQDIYLDDADDGGEWSGARSAGEGGSDPQVMEIPQSRAKSFLGSLGDRISGGGRKKESFETSPATWLGVDEGYDARSEGSSIGSWQNFSEEEDEGWMGGAAGGSSYEEEAAALARYSSTLIDKEVWIVAVGSHENKNAGIKSLLLEYERELRNALIINLDSVGTGNLYYTMAEGSFRKRGTDHRLQGLVKSASEALGAGLAPIGFGGYNTEATEALASGARAISILGLDGALPAGWRWSDDRLDIIDEDNLQTVADVVVEVIKSI